MTVNRRSMALVAAVRARCEARRTMSEPARFMVLVAIAVTVSMTMVPAVEAQSMLGRQYGRGYPITVVERDLADAGCAVDATVLVDAYLVYCDAWLAARREARLAAANARGGDPGAYLGQSGAERTVRSIKRLQTVEQAAELHLLQAVMAAPECAAALQQIANWRRSEHAATVVRTNQVTGQGFELGQIIRGLDLDGEERRRVLDQLARSEERRRAAMEGFQAAIWDGEIRAGAVVDAEGMVGVHQGPGRYLPPAYYHAHQPDPLAVADYLDTQLASFKEIEPLLPAAMRRNVIDPFLGGTRLMGARGPMEGLPRLGVHIAHPTELGRIVLAWQGLDPARRPATREALAAWLAEVDALYVSELESQIAGLRTGASVQNLTSPSPGELGSWEALAKKHLPLLVEASNAQWLLGDTLPELTEVDYQEDDLAVTGSRRSYGELLARGQEYRRVGHVLPVALGTDQRESILRALHRSPREVVEVILADHDEAWRRDVEPLVTQAVVPDDWYRDDFETRTTRLEPVFAAQRSAFAAADATDARLFESLRTVCDPRDLHAVARLEAARASGDVLTRASQGTASVSRVSLEPIGGAIFDVASALGDVRVNDRDRDAAELALGERWAPILQLARETRDAQVENRRNVLMQPFERPRDPGRDAEDAANRQRESARINRWRQEIESMTAQVLDAIAAHGGDVTAVRAVFEEMRFPSSTQALVRHRALVSAFEAVPIFAGREGVQQRLQAIAARLERIAADAISDCLPLLPLNGMDDQEARRLRGDAQLRADDNQIASFLLEGAAKYLIRTSMPADLLETSPELRRRVGN